MENGTLIHYLDGVEVERPKGEIDFTEEIERNFDQRIIATQYPIEVTFKGGGYERLRTLFVENYCTSVTYTVDFDCGETYRVARGIISVADVVWNLNKCEAEVKVQDDGYGARIFNNKEIKVYPTATLTKNGLDLTPVTHTDLEIFDPTAAIGVYLADTRRVYDWLECMEHLVAYITDNELTIESDWYEALADDERLCLAYGREVRVADGSSLAPQFSFKDLFANAWKKYNLWAYISRSTTGDPVLRIEQEAATYTSTTAKSYPDQDDLEQTTESDLLYERVEVGSETYIKDEDGNFSIPFVRLQGFVKEEIHLSGTCNNDSALDLVSSFVIDNNVIEDCCLNNNDEYDEDTFMIQYSPYLARATKSDYLVPGSTPYLYNEQLLNINVLERFPLPGDGVINIGAQDADFLATDYQVQNAYATGPLSAGTPVSSSAFQVRFQNDYAPPNFDTNNHWGNGTPPGTTVTAANSRFTATDMGFYEFDALFNWDVFRHIVSNGDYDEQMILFVRMELYDSGNNLLSSQLFADTQDRSVGPYSNTTTEDTTLSFSFPTTYAMFMQASNYVIIMGSYFYDIDGIGLVGSPEATFQIIPETHLGTSFIATGGGTIIKDPDEYRATLYRFDRSCPASDWVSLRDNPIDMVRVATDQLSFRNAHVKKATRFIATGETEWELIANRDQQFK